MTTLKSYRSKTKPAPNWMVNADATPLERNPPPKSRRPKPNTPSNKGKAKSR
jgi:hypothetical protein